MAPLWTVHIDHVRPASAAEFERLNIAENKGIHAIMSKHGQPIKPVYEIMTVGAVYMSMRPRLSFTDFDAPSTAHAKCWPTTSVVWPVPRRLTPHRAATSPTCLSRCHGWVCRHDDRAHECRGESRSQVRWRAGSPSERRYEPDPGMAPGNGRAPAGIRRVAPSPVPRLQLADGVPHRAHGGGHAGGDCHEVRRSVAADVRVGRRRRRESWVGSGALRSACSAPRS